MAVNLSPIWGAGAQLLDNSGNVLTGGKIYTYLAGTTTPATTYTSSNGNTANSNPIILNSAGRVPYEIWLTDSIEYKFVLKDSNDTLIGTWDNLVGINSNFINYYGQQEIQTATAGQTVFTLTEFEYEPGTGNLSVFVDGVNQYGPGAQYAFVETNSTTITFVSGLHVGASVKFTTTKLENPGVADASQVSYTYPDSNAVPESVEARLAQYVSVKDFGAVGDGVADDTDAIQNAIDAAATFGGTVIVPAGNYKLTATINLSPKVTLQGQGYPYPVSAYNPDTQFTGVVFNKLHNGHCILVQGLTDNSEGAGINGISIISDLSIYTTGDGIRIDKVSMYYIENCNVWSCGGNGFTIGVTSGDVTGNNTLRNCYVNNCGDSAYFIRSKWFTAYNIKSDGCEWGVYSDNSPESYINSFHFEGMTIGAINLVNGNAEFVFQKGFISLTNPAALYGVLVNNVAGNGSFVFDSIHVVADPAAVVSNVGFTLPSASWESGITNCQIENWKIGITNSGSYNTITNSNFVTCILPIQEQGAYTRIIGNSFIDTSGSYDIDHVAGQGDGSWTNNTFDKPLKPTAYGGTTGNFGTNIVKNNNNFKTQAIGQTSGIASGTTIPHGLSVTPQFVFVSPVSPYTTPVGLVIGYDATNITLIWTGGGTVQWNWQAYATCAGQG